MRYPCTVSLLVACLLLAACKPDAPRKDGTQAPARAGTASAATKGALPHDNLNAVLWMQRAAEYDAVTQTVYRGAAEQLARALSEPNWDALVPGERGNASTGLPPAVIVDIDETVLDNSPYQARLVHEGKEYDEVSWDQWVAEKKARPVPGVVDFAKAAAAKGITVLYLSNRAVHLKEATLANLRAVGLPVADDSVFLGLGTFVAGCEQEGSEKNCRRKLAGQKFRVLMQFGDQLGDFVQIAVNTPADRDALYAEYADWFGERWFMLPNPTYGSWEPAIFNNDWGQAADQRRSAKLDALDLAR